MLFTLFLNCLLLLDRWGVFLEQENMYGVPNSDFGSGQYIFSSS
jgi:hypothetical protein